MTIAAEKAHSPGAAELKRMMDRFAPVELVVDTSKLSQGDREALRKLIEAAHRIDDLFLNQMWAGNPALLAGLERDRTPPGRARLAYFWLNKGPWSSLDEHKAFLAGVPARKPPGANFYPPDMTRGKFEAWVKTLPAAEREQARGFFTVVRAEGGKLRLVPFSKEYATDLDVLARLLREAASLTDNASLKRYLAARAAGLLSNDYYASDIAWMDLDAPLDITIGPYETYNDELFGYKASFEAYITLRDDTETEKVRFFASRLQEIENNLPIEPKYKNPKLGALAPIRVVNEIIASGDAAKGVRTAAFNLPNDERVIREKGSKRVMLRNVQEAKFRSILQPVARRMLPAGARAHLSFDWFFTHILAHELTHGIGPHTIRVAGRESVPRKELKELYSAIEEAKADATGLFLLQYMLDRRLLPEAGAAAERQLYTTFLASSFRTLRFGVSEAHARGMAVQFNYLRDKGAFLANPDGTFAVDFAKIRGAVRDLVHDLLMLEATADYSGARKLIETLGVPRPELQKALDRLKDIPTDINPTPVTANAVYPSRRW